VKQFLMTGNNNVDTSLKRLLSRRDFLKLAGMISLGIAKPDLVNTLSGLQEAGKKQNVIIVVFDAFSASNISLYGYTRETMPNLWRWIDRAVVYHNHYAGGNYTTPGTASLLTGTLPWTHRAIGYYDAADKSFVDKNIFTAFQGYHRLAYTHNPVANVFLTQFSKWIDDHVPLSRLFLSNDEMINTLFNGDEDIASVSWVRTMKSSQEGYAYSLFLSHLYSTYRERQIAGMREQYPYGPPHIAGDNFFLLEDAIDWLGENMGNLPEPFMGYFHLMPPHLPYNTHKDFFGYFDGDGLVTPFKPLDIFSTKKTDRYEFLLRRRTDYDEFILYVDREFGRLMDEMERSGLLENTWVVLTSDHGEMFERGIFGHWTPVLYQPVIRVPLMIFEPGRKEREDIYVNTSAVDLLPTILEVTGQQPADWCEGAVIPPYQSGDHISNRNLFVVQAMKHEPNEALMKATVALVTGSYKMMYFTGYNELEGQERVELYDLEKDPEEMEDLSSSKEETTAELLDMLKAKLSDMNEPYL
jgi:arylsulfatase A-like enzyme